MPWSLYAFDATERPKVEPSLARVERGAADSDRSRARDGALSAGDWRGEGAEMSDGLIGAIVGGTIAIVGAFVNGWWSAREQKRREHDARVHGWRADAYKELLRVTRRIGAIVEMTMPVLDEGRPAPSAPNDDELDVLTASTAAFGSEPVRQIAEQMRLTQNKFFRTVQAYQEEKTHGAAPGSRDQLDRYRKVEEVRTEYRDLHRKLSEIVATELQEN